MDFDEIYGIIRTIPVSVNNYYGDPVIQWEDTLHKISVLSRDGHKGPVSIITKGYISPKMARELKEASKGLNLIVLVSISELPLNIEPIIPQGRYETLCSLNREEIPAIAYIRPFIPPYNTTAKTIRKMYAKISETSTGTAIVSGFRGNDEIIAGTNPAQKEKWVTRVKLMPDGISSIIEECSEKFGIKTFSRTSCGVSYKLGFKRSFNPYYNSPAASGCGTCPLKPTCGPEPLKPKSLELIELLGYEVDYISETQPSVCTVTAANRLSCKSCCTSCFVLGGVQRIDCKTSGVRLGDIAFMRFLTGALCSGKDVADTGKADVGHVHFPKMPMPEAEIHCINTWYPWARQMSKCFGCSYCITKVFDLKEKEYGVPPKELALHIYENQAKDRSDKPCCSAAR